MPPMLVQAMDADSAPVLMKPYFAGGDPGPILATMANVPELTEVAMPFLGASLGANFVDFRTKEIIIVRTSALLGCRYCVDSHTTVALDAGLTFKEVCALRNASELIGTEVFGDRREQALLAWIDAVAEGRGPLPESVNTGIKAHFADHEIVEITVLIGSTMLLNRYATALQLPVGADTLTRLAKEGFTSERDA